MNRAIIKPIATIFLLTAFVPVLLPGLAAQSETQEPVYRLVTPGRDGIEETRPIHKGEAAYLALTDGKIVSRQTVQSEDVDVIIELQEPALAQSARGLSTAGLVSLVEQREATLTGFAGRIIQAENRVRSARGLAAVSPDSIVRRRFSLLFNGLAASLSRETVAQLRQFPEVKRVWPDTVKRAYLDKSVSKIGADRVWSEFDVTGKGVVVAVVDSGIDYRHADLGGCLGPECRVKGGYNFVKNNNNPSDDNGHGTHVAGIIAANGTVKGVAPDAKLLAVKVLDQDGAGLSSGIIAGIEWAALNGADVINLSLGSAGSPDDPTSLTVDNAVDFGCVVVVAAGNNGPAYDTLGSPAVARKAVTVGASDDQDGIASFSSRGPSILYQMKPEILAPGVAIHSTVPKGSCAECDASGYKDLDGTSMATPHVAGAAALLLERYPDWNPQQVKDALTQASVDLGLNPFVQGAGRLDVYGSATLPVLLSGGAILNLGLDDLTGPVFSRSQILTLKNLGNGAASCQLSVEGNLPTGMTTGLSSTSVDLAPGETKTVTFQMNLDNVITPHSEREPFNYSGRVVANFGGGLRAQVPFLVVKSPVLAVDFGDEPGPSGYVVSVHNATWNKFYNLFARTIAVSVPPGSVDVVSVGLDSFSYVVNEGVSMQQRTELSAAENLAVHSVSLQPIFHTGLTSGPAAYSCTLTSLRSKDGKMEFRAVVPDEVREWQFSNMSSAYTFEISQYRNGIPFGNTSYIFQAAVPNGISRPVTCRNSRLDFAHAVFRQAGNAAIDKAVSVTGLGYRDGSGLELISPPLGAPLDENFYLLSVPTPDFQIGYYTERVYRSSAVPTNLLYRSPYFRAIGSPPRLDGYMPFDFTEPVVTTSGGIVPLGVGPYFWSARFNNKPEEIQIGPAVGDFLWLYLGQNGDRRTEPNFNYELWQGTKKIKTGTIPGPTTKLIPLSWGLTGLVPGTYTFKSSSDLSMLGAAGQAAVSATFNTGASDPNPPYLKRFQIATTLGASPTVPAEGAEVRFKIGDNKGVSNLGFSYDIGHGFQEGTVRSLGSSEYAVSIPAPDSLIKLKLDASDAAGNQLVYETSAQRRLLDLGVGVSHTGDFKINTKPIFNVKITNLGTEPAVGSLRVVDTLPAGLKYEGFSGTGWTCSSAGQRTTCENPGPLQVGDDITVGIKTLVTAAAAQYTSVISQSYPDDMEPSNDQLTDYVITEAWSTPALAQDGITSLAVDPSNRDVMYAGTGRGVFKTTDRGTNWVICNAGVDLKVKTISIDPGNPSVVYVGNTGQGVYKTTDGGTTWAPMNTGFGSSTSVNALLVPLGKTNLVFAGTANGGVFKTTDGGQNWTSFATGLTNKNVLSLAIDPVRSSVILAGTSAGIFKSNTDNANWTPILTQATALLVKAIVFDPHHIDTVYAATSQGVFKSSDAGSTWEQHNLGLNRIDVNCLVIDSEQSDMIYIGTAGGGTYRSLDGGTMWSSFGLGASTSTVACLIINGSIIAGTNKGILALTLRPDLAVAMSRPAALLAGSLVTYAISVSNAGLAEAQGTTTLVDTLPAGLAFVSASGSQWSCSATGNEVRCTRSTPIPTGFSSEVFLSAMIDDVAPTGLTNTATITNTEDVNYVNNTFADYVTVLSTIPLWFPFYQGNAASFTGFALSNTATSDAQLAFLAFGPDGTLLPLPQNPAVRELAPNAQLAEVGNELFGVAPTADQAGWVKMVSDQKIAGFFLFGGGSQLDGSVAFPDKAKKFYFTRVFEGSKAFRNQGASTSVSLVNPTSLPVTLNLTLYNSQSVSIGSQTRTIPARGYLYSSLPGLFGAGVSVSGGYIVVECTEGDGAIGFELIQLTGYQTLIGLNVAFPNDLNLLYSAQLADMPGLFTSIKLINTSTQPRTVTLTAIGNDSKPLAESAIKNLAAGQMLESDAGQIFGWPAGAANVGSLKVQSNGPGIVGDVVFGDSNTFVYTAALPLQTVKFTKAIFSQVANGMGLFTGIALYNPEPSTATVTIQVYSPEGEKTGEVELDLPSGNRTSQLLSELVPATTGQIRGYVLIQSTKPLIAQALFGDGNFLSAIPPTTIQ